RGSAGTPVGPRITFGACDASLLRRSRPPSSPRGTPLALDAHEALCAFSACGLSRRRATFVRDGRERVVSRPRSRVRRGAVSRAMSGWLIPLGQLLGISFATGLNLYATVAAIGLAARLGWIPALPPELAGLGNWLLVATATLLFLVEFFVDKIRYVDSIWDTLHTFIRPPAAALLGMGLLGGLPIEARIGGATPAGAAAFIAHGTKAGLRLAIHASSLGRAGPAISVAEDALAIGLAILAIRYPAAALVLAGGWIGVAVLVGPRLWRAFVLGIRALHARGHRFIAPGRWRERDELPARMRSLLGPP